MKRYQIGYRLLPGFLLLLSSRAMPQLQLSALYADSMVLQCGKPLNIKGMAAPGTAVAVQLGAIKRQTVAGKKGHWQVHYPPLRPGLVGILTVAAGTEKKIFRHVLAGEVWVCSGQSNMEFTLNSFKEVYAAEMAQAADRQLRFSIVENAVDNKERTQPVLRRNWTGSYPGTVGDCSAVAWFYGRALRKKLGVPVGLIISAWGGTPAQAWMDTAALQPFAAYSNTYRTQIAPINFAMLDSEKAAAAQQFQQQKTAAQTAFTAMRQPDYDDAAWEATTVPGNWEEHGHPGLDGIAAYRIRFTAPLSSDTTTSILYLPAIDDVDSTYINGVFVGSHNVWNEPRRYVLLKGILKPGLNTLTIWIEDGQGGGGINNAPHEFYIGVGSQKIMLSGAARMKVLATVGERLQQLTGMQYQPAVLFNAMIAPLLQHSIRGVIWYQGESNADKAVEYRQLFPALIQQWRRRWQQRVLPFLFVQLSSWNPGGNEPNVSNWALLREAQAMTLRLPAIGMAVTTDVGDLLDIHPKRKKEVGERLAANALHRVYGRKDVVAQGPVFQSAYTKGDTIIVQFKPAQSGLVYKGDKLFGFAIAGKDKKFYTAQAKIQDNKVVVYSSSIKTPVYVRYAWANAPLEANLYNTAGLPAAPFRTDKD